MAGEDDDLILDDPKDKVNGEGLETEKDAGGENGDEEVGGLDVEGAAEGERTEAEGQDAVLAEEPKLSRGERRLQALANETKAAKEELGRERQARQELAERLGRLEQPRQAQPTGPSAEQIALMTPDELIDHKLGLASKRFEQQLGQIQWNTYEAGDKANFQALVRTDPQAARYADEVEQRLTAMRAQGQNVDRERLLTFIVGEKVRERSKGAKEKQAAEGKTRIARQTVKPGAARSDTAPNRGKMSDAEARAKRLENMTF